MRHRGVPPGSARRMALLCPLCLLCLLALTVSGCLRETRGCVTAADCPEGSTCVDDDCLYVLADASRPDVDLDARPADAEAVTCAPEDRILEITRRETVFEASTVVASPDVDIHLARGDGQRVVGFRRGHTRGRGDVGLVWIPDGGDPAPPVFAAPDELLDLDDIAIFQGLVRLLWHDLEVARVSSVDSAGNMRDPAAVTISSLGPRADGTALLDIGDRQAALWGRYDGPTTRSNHLSWLDRDDNLTAFPISLESLGRPDAIATPEGFALIGAIPDNLRLTRYDESGGRHPDTVPVSATPVSVTCVDATPADAHAAVAWTAEEGLSTRIRLAFVDSRAPEPVDGIPIARAAPGMVQGCPQLGASDTDVLIAWSEAPPPEADTRGPHRLHLSWARSDGGVGDPLLVADGLDVVGGYAVMAEADGFLLSWIGALGGQTRVEVVRGELRCPAPTR